LFYKESEAWFYFLVTSVSPCPSHGSAQAPSIPDGQRTAALEVQTSTGQELPHSCPKPQKIKLNIQTVKQRQHGQNLIPKEKTRAETSANARDAGWAAGTHPHLHPTVSASEEYLDIIYLHRILTW